MVFGPIDSAEHRHRKIPLVLVDNDHPARA
jgi:hypothetical protein